MTAINDYRRLDNSAGPARWLGAFIDAWHRGREARRAYRAIHEELSRLSDRDLADIGLVRGDIDNVARTAAEKAAARS